MIKKIILNSLFGSLSLILITACGSNTKPDDGSLPPSERGISATIACSEEPDALDKAFLVAHCYVHTVDGNSKPVSGMEYEVSLINKVKVYKEGTGALLTTEPISFSDSSVNFALKNVHISDSLIVFPSENAYDPATLGNWKIASVNADLTLRDIAYNLETTEELSYVIGKVEGAHIEPPKEGGQADEEGNDNSLDREGFFYFDLIYDHSLRGTTMIIGAHTPGNRVGTATEIILEQVDGVDP